MPNFCHRGEHEIGLFVVSDGADREALEAELGGIHHRSAGRAGDGQADLVDELDVAAVGYGDDRPAQDVEDVEADDRDVVAHGDLLLAKRSRWVLVSGEGSGESPRDHPAIRSPST